MIDAVRKSRDAHYAYLVWVSRNKKEARIESDATSWEFSIDYYNDTKIHTPKFYRPKWYWVRFFWWRITKGRT